MRNPRDFHTVLALGSLKGMGEDVVGWRTVALLGQVTNLRIGLFGAPPVHMLAKSQNLSQHVHLGVAGAVQVKATAARAHLGICR